jgi:hypothetical protein
MLGRLCAGTVGLLAMTACATVDGQRTVDSSCINFAPGTYANAKAGHEHDDDLGNVLDTPETVLWIAAFNASWRAVCDPAR